MRYIIHGEDTISSRNYLDTLRDQYQEIRIIDGERSDQTLIREALESESLFNKKVAVVVENYKGSNEIFNVATHSDEIFWWPKTIKSLPPADKVLHFKDQSGFGVFKYADSLALKQEKAALSLLNRLFEDRVPPEKIIAILARQFKMIGQVLDGQVKKASTSEFVQKKMAKQSEYWDLNKLQEGLTLLFLVDVKIKKGLIKPEAGLVFLTHRICK